MGFFDFLHDNNDFKLITISNGQNTRSINAKLIYSFPRIKVYKIKDQGFIASGIFRNSSEENYIEFSNLENLIHRALYLGIDPMDAIKMLPDLLGFDYFEKNNDYLTVGGVPKVIDHFYLSYTTTPDDDDGWDHQSTIVNANKAYNFFDDRNIYFVNDGSYFIDGGLHIGSDGKILSDRGHSYLFTTTGPYQFAMLDAFSRKGIRLKVPKYLHEKYKSGQYKEISKYTDVLIYD